MRAIVLLVLLTGCGNKVADCLTQRCEQLCTKRSTADRSDYMRDSACQACIAACRGE